MQPPWHDYGFDVVFTQLAPGEKLAEVKLLEHLAISQWQSIAKLVGRPTQEISNASGDRLYGSLIDVEVDFAGQSPEQMGEGSHVHVHNRVSLFARRFVEGLFVFGADGAPDDALAKVETKADLAALGLPWAYMTNAFIARLGGNTALKVFELEGADALPYPELAERPIGIQHQREALASGGMPGCEPAAGGIALEPWDAAPVVYPIVPESDLNGAGLVLFARFVAMANYAERLFLTRHLRPRLSDALVATLSCEHRRIFYFGNVQPQDRVEIAVSARLLPPSSFERRPASRHATAFKLEVRTELVRESDGVLVARSQVRKAANVPRDAKPVLAETRRLLERLGAS